MAEKNSGLVSELAALYALGCFTGEERAEVEERLQSGDIALREEFERNREALGQLALTVTPVRPPQSLKERLMAQVRPPALPPESPILINEGGLLLSTAARMQWRPSLLPGVWTKTLFIDKRRGFRTALVRLEPGSEIPGHRHNDVEELYVIEGEMEIHGHLVGPGGYCRAEPESVHLTGRSKSGCVFLAVCSLADKYVPESRV